jgi:ABC-type phosphate/phosphonate transport system substrate-binding protein
VLASLPCYDFPANQPRNDALWQHLRRHLLAAGLPAPPGLERGLDRRELLCSDDWLLSQTCGYVAAGVGRSAVQIVATPCYDAPGCEGTDYRSFVVVRQAHPARCLADLRGATCAVDDALSHSGLNCLRALVYPAARDGRFFGAVSVSGSHVDSLAMVQDGSADTAAIDCVLLALLRDHADPRADGLRIIASTAPSAAPPFVTRKNLPARDLQALRQALAALVADPEAKAACAAVRLAGFVQRPLGDYMAMLAWQQQAVDAGYRELELPPGDASAMPT